MNPAEADARTSPDTALDHYEAWKEGRSDKNEQALLEGWTHDTGLFTAAVKAGHPSGLAYLRDHSLWDQPMQDIFKWLEAPKPTYDGDTLVKDLTEADLDAEVTRKTKCTGHSRHMTLRAAIESIRRQLDDRGDILALLDGKLKGREVNGGIEYDEDADNEAQPLSDWISYDNDHHYTY